MSVKYTVIATNRMESAEDVVKWYNQRGDCSENRIKELMRLRRTKDRLWYGKDALWAI